MWVRKDGIRGFTLVEILITVSIMALLLAIAVPSFKDASLNSQLRSLANEFVASAALARSEAIKRNAVVTLCVSTDGETCAAGGWEQGWLITQGGTDIQSKGGAPAGFKITEKNGLDTLSFQPIGAGATSAELTLCRATPTVGRSKRVVTLTTTGRASVKTATATSCS